MADSSMQHGANALEAKGFIKSLHDFRFVSFVAMRMLKVLYVIITILYSLAALGFLIGAIVSANAASIILGVILVPIGYIVYLVFARLTIEVIMVIFRIGADVRSLAERSTGSDDSTSN